jgi:hypothetical protein
MQIALLIPEYFVWHYTTALRLCLNIVSNFIWFTYNFFSIPILLKSFFSPLKHAEEHFKSSFRHTLPIEVIIAELVSRFVGLVFRACVIFFGVTLSVAIALIGLCFFVFWLFLPFIIIALIFEGINNLFQ